LALLAGSCLAQMPPLTFFKGLVVDDGGNQSDVLDLRRSAVFPLIDSARAFGLARATRQPGTFDRLSGAAELLPGSRETFEAAKEAYRMTLQQRGRAGLLTGDDGVHIRPASLSKYEQQVLKGAFRSILELLELTGEYFRAVVGR
jgi:CBS domain-containing protein